jgi:hypothetical protein
MKIIDNSGTKRLLMVIHSMLSTFLLVGLQFVVHHKHFWQFFTVGKNKRRKETSKK